MSLSRRNWHSSSQYSKVIWQCVKATKQGKRFCPDSKGIPEYVIEEAFVESYRMLCSDNKDVLDEFLKRVERTLNENSYEDQAAKLNKDISKVQVKRKKLLDNYLTGVVAQDIYEEMDVGLEKEYSNLKAQLTYCEQQIDDEQSLQRRLNEFKKALSNNEVLEEFDRSIFESIIEKVIVGGYDEDGNKDPYKITFIYKTGFKNEIDNTKARFDKSKKPGDSVSKMCSHISDKVKDFLGTDMPRREVEIEKQLTEHIQKFLLELGQGFAFVGRQVHLEVGGQDFYIDLLFYHLKLRCYVVIELKACDFEPGFISQLNMYQNVVNDLLKHPDDKPTIGLLMVKGKNQTVVEYSLSGYQNPIGVAEWKNQLTESLPEELKSSLPSIEEIEKELE